MKSNYFANQINNVNENDFLNFDDFGYNADDMSFDGQAEVLNATGAQAAQVSQPYIVSIQNTTTDALADVEILNAYAKHSSFAVTGANITYGITGISYREFLYQSMMSPFSCGMLRLDSSTTANVTTVITVTTKDANGNQVARSFNPEYDRYQNITTVADINYQFLVNGFTAIKLTAVAASSTVLVKIYPALKVNNLNALSGQAQLNGYKNPNVNALLRRGIAR